MNIANYKIFLSLQLIMLSAVVQTADRSSSYPYVSGDTFRAFADLIIDETGQSVNVEAIKKGDIIFLKTDYMHYFFSEIHPRIKHQYILLTHNSDYAVPGNFAHYLDDPKLYAWYGQNIDRDHPKLFPVPIGLANRYWPHGQSEVVAKEQAKSYKEEKTITLYINYAASTSSERTNKGLEELTKCSFAYVPSRKPFAEYITDLAHSVFVVSPPGNGKDCHRTWEALYLGAFPIVKKSTICPLYEDLPILVVEDWAEVTEQKLKETVAEFNRMPRSVEKAYAQYWFNVLSNAKTNCKNNL